MRTSCLRDLEDILPVSGKEFSVLTPTMHEELYIARKVSANPKMGHLEGITHLLSTLVTRLGDVDFETNSTGRVAAKEYRKVIKELSLLPASDVLALYLTVQMEIDSSYEFDFECDSDTCGAKNKATYDIGQLEVVVIEDDDEPYRPLTLKKGIEQVEGIVKDVVLTHILWKHLYKVRNLEENKIAMLKHGVLTSERLPITLSSEMLHNIHTADRRLIYKVSDEVPGGAKVAFDVTCPTCDKECVWTYSITESFDFFM